MKYIKTFFENDKPRFTLDDMTSEFINDVLIDIVDDGFIIHGPYIKNAFSELSYVIDKGISEEDIFHGDYDNEELYNRAHFNITEVLDSLQKLVDYTGLKYDFVIGDFDQEDSIIYSIDDLYTIGERKISYISIDICIK
jgi:hypothetical protein